MDSKTKKGLIVAVVVIAAVAIAWKVTNKSKNQTIEDFRSTVTNHLNATFGYFKEHTTFVSNATPSYITAWAKAIMAGSPTFTDNGNTYSTSGGTSVKK